MNRIKMLKQQSLDLQNKIASLMHDTGWVVYQKNDDGYKELNNQLKEKNVELWSVYPDIILCRGDSLYGVVETKLPKKTKSPLYAEGRYSSFSLIRLVHVFILTDGIIYETFLNGEYYGRLDHPLSPDDIDAINLRRANDKEWRAFNKKATSSESDRTEKRIYSFQAERLETYRGEYFIEIPPEISDDNIEEYIASNIRLWKKQKETLVKVKESAPGSISLVKDNE